MRIFTLRERETHADKKKACHIMLEISELTDINLSSIVEVTQTQIFKPDIINCAQIKYTKFLENIPIRDETSQ